MSIQKMIIKGQNSVKNVGVVKVLCIFSYFFCCGGWGGGVGLKPKQYARLSNEVQYKNAATYTM